MSLEFRHYKAGALRDIFIQGIADILEYGLLKDKKVAEELRLDRQDKDILLDLATNVVLARPKGTESPWFEINVRSLCHSSFVTADYLNISERFNMKQCVLILGDLGNSPAPWAEFIKIAIYLYQHEFNVLWFEVPQFASDPIRYYNYGPGLVMGLLKLLGIDQVSVLGHGLGAGIFLSTLPLHPSYFGKTHFLFNPNLPGVNNIDAHAIDGVLHKQELQLWIAYHDMPPQLDRNKDTGYGRTFTQMLKVQTRCLGDQRKGKRILHFDEVMLSEDFKDNQLKKWRIGLNPVYIASEDFLKALARFFELPPESRQVDMVDGLPGKKGANEKGRRGSKALARSVTKEAATGEPGVLPALRQLKEMMEGGASLEDAQKAGDMSAKKRLQNGVRAIKMLSALGGPGMGASQSAPSLPAIGDGGAASSSAGFLPEMSGAASSLGDGSSTRSGKKKKRDKKDKQKKMLLDQMHEGRTRSDASESGAGEGSVAVGSMALQFQSHMSSAPTDFLADLTTEEQENPRVVEAARMDAKLLDSVREISRDDFHRSMEMEERKAQARSLADQKARIEGPKRIIAAAKTRSERDEQHARLMRDEEGQLRAVLQATTPKASGGQGWDSASQASQGSGGAQGSQDALPSRQASQEQFTPTSPTSPPMGLDTIPEGISPPRTRAQTEDVAEAQPIAPRDLFNSKEDFAAGDPGSPKTGPTRGRPVIVEPGPSPRPSDPGSPKTGPTRGRPVIVEPGPSPRPSDPGSPKTVPTRGRPVIVEPGSED